MLGRPSIEDVIYSDVIENEYSYACTEEVKMKTLQTKKPLRPKPFIKPKQPVTGVPHCTYSTEEAVCREVKNEEQPVYKELENEIMHRELENEEQPVYKELENEAVYRELENEVPPVYKDVEREAVYKDLENDDQSTYRILENERIYKELENENVYQEGNNIYHPLGTNNVNPYEGDYQGLEYMAKTDFYQPLDAI